jgi:hypothetical protein
MARPKKHTTKTVQRRRPQGLVDENSNPADVRRLPRSDELVMSNEQKEVELTIEPGDW